MVQRDRAPDRPVDRPTDLRGVPWEEAPRYLIRDRDRAYGPPFRMRVERMGIEEVLTAHRSPWQNPFAERVIGSVRRECLDHVIAFP
jgi:putative transposase